MRDVYLSENAEAIYAEPIDVTSCEYMAIESFLAENPQPRNDLTREGSKESFIVKEWCGDFPGEEVLANKGQLAYERIMGVSNHIMVLYSYDANKVIIHYYAESGPMLYKSCPNPYK